MSELNKKVNLITKIILEMGSYDQYRLNFDLGDMLKELKKLDEKFVLFIPKYKVFCGVIYFYEQSLTGTWIPKDVFTDAEGETPNANPVVLDSEGNANIFMKKVEIYDILYKDDTGKEIGLEHGFKVE